MKWLVGGDGLIWFVGASYSFVAPQGFSGHFRFAIALPGAVYRYMRLRAKP